MFFEPLTPLPKELPTPRSRHASIETTLYPLAGKVGRRRSVLVFALKGTRYKAKSTARLWIYLYLASIFNVGNALLARENRCWMRRPFVPGKECKRQSAHTVTDGDIWPPITMSADRLKRSTAETPQTAWCHRLRSGAALVSTAAPTAQNAPSVQQKAARHPMPAAPAANAP